MTLFTPCFDSSRTDINADSDSHRPCKVHSSWFYWAIFQVWTMNTFLVVLVAFYAAACGGKIVSTSRFFSIHFLRFILRSTVNFTGVRTCKIFPFIIPANEELKCRLRQWDSSLALVDFGKILMNIFRSLRNSTILWYFRNLWKY